MCSSPGWQLWADPARQEMLFTLASREDRFKDKTGYRHSCYRGGDVIMGWFFWRKVQGLGLGLAAIAAVGAGIAAVWAFCRLSTGRRFDRQEAEHLDEVETIAAKTSK